MSIVKKFILPAGKVHKLYFQYIGWSLASNIITSVEAAISTDSMLQVIGECSESYRTMNYIGKDIIGQVGGLAYMAKLGKTADKNPKSFLLYSNMMQQLSFISITVTPLLSSNLFLPVAGMSNVMQNICFTGFGAINAKCIQTLAIDNNIGEIYAKITIINTIGSSIGLIIGLGITSIVPDHSVRLGLVPLFGLLRVHTFNRAIRDIV
jgi:hypothetical protein